MEMLSFDCVHDALQAMTEQLAAAVRQKTDGPFHIALSGGGTAKLLFRLWAQEYVRKIAWSRLRFYWVDERCVPPDDPESNFKYADELLFQKIGIPDNHLFRIRGEEDPEQEARRYAAAVRAELPLQDGLPRFDAVVLGIGDDGHTASIFPHTPGLLTDPACYAVSRHPVTGQWRITMTGPLILNGAELLFPVIGPGKAEILQKIAGPQGAEYPAGYILRRAERAAVYTNCKI